jgi:tetratricopeptide (TPR) repeat protein
MKKHLIWILVVALAQGCSSTPSQVANEDPAAKAERLLKEKEAAEAAARKRAYGEALAALKARKYGEARDKARLALKAAPGDAALEEALAYALLNLGDYTEADALFVKLRKVSPDRLALTLAHADLMRRRNKGKDVADGTKLLEGLAKKDEFNEDILANLVVFYRLQDKVKQAEKTIRKLLSRHPDSVSAYMNLSMIYFAKGQTSKGASKKKMLARAESVTALVFDKLKTAKLKPAKEHSPLYNNLGMIWIERGDLARALVNFEKAVELDSKHLTAHLNIGAIALRYRDFGRARKHYGNVLKQEPSHLEALEAVGHAQAGKLEAKEAVKTFEKVLKLQPKNARVMLALAVVQERQLSKLEIAVSLYEKWIGLKGGSGRLGKDHAIIKKVSELKEQIQMLKEFGDG